MQCVQAKAEGAAMNQTEQRIFEIIRADVCRECGAGGTPACHLIHRDRCHAGYKRQAKAIYEAVVKPLKEDLELVERLAVSKLPVLKAERGKRREARSA